MKKTDIMINKENETRKNAIEKLIADVNAHKSIKNITLVIDYVRDSEKSDSMISSQGTLSTSKGLNAYDKIHVYATDTRKQLFYIRTMESRFRFVVNSRIAMNLDRNNEMILGYRQHNTDNCYTVSHENGFKFFSLVLDAMKKASEKNFEKVEEPKEVKKATVKKATTQTQKKKAPQEKKATTQEVKKAVVNK